MSFRLARSARYGVRGSCWLSALIRKRGAPERCLWVVAGYVLEENISVLQMKPLTGGVRRREMRVCATDVAVPGVV